MQADKALVETGCYNLLGPACPLILERGLNRYIEFGLRWLVYFYQSTLVYMLWGMERLELISVSIRAETSYLDQNTLNWILMHRF